MTMYEMIRKNRSYRRFYEDEAIGEQTLLELIDLGRLAPNGGNRQPLRYCYINDAKNEIVFRSLGWAAQLKDWKGPERGERPSAYIIVLTDPEINKTPLAECGIAAHSILLGAAEKGLGGCMLRNIKIDQLKAELHIPEKYDVVMVIALGKPKEMVVIEEIELGKPTNYYRDAVQVHHVPKLRLKDVVVPLN